MIIFTVSVSEGGGGGGGEPVVNLGNPRANLHLYETLMGGLSYHH